MSRGYEPDDFTVPREFSEEDEQKSRPPSLDGEPHAREREACAQREGCPTDPGAARSAEPPSIYEIPGRRYRLRSSEILTMTAAGKFRAIALEDLTEFAYGDDRGRMKLDVEDLVRQGLLQMKSVPHEEKGSRQLLTLSKAGHRFLTEHNITGRDQALYFGFANPRQAHHDADLYRLYRRAAEKIERGGGRNLCVVLDYELKKRVNHDLAQSGPDRASAQSQRNVSERHGLQVVLGKIPLPDVRIEYDTPDGERARLDVELVTSHYRGPHLAEKVRAGFTLYARAGDVSNLRRVLGQYELTAEILSL